MKVCTKCKEPKDVGAFCKDSRRSDGLNLWCRGCKKAANARTYPTRRKRILATSRAWYSSNKPRKRAAAQEWLRQHPGAGASYTRRYRANHRDRHRQLARDGVRARRKADVQFKLSCVLRERLRHALKTNQRSGSAVRDLGCTIPELRTWLETKFYPHPETAEAMSWENYGDWHIDHKKALKHFDLTDREQFLQACHYTNLQPLWAKDNLAKGAREAA